MEDEIDLEWQGFIEKIKEYASHDPQRWRTMSFLSYFVNKYEEANGVPYIFNPNKNGPNKSKEMKDASRIWKAFDRGRYTAIPDKDEKEQYKIQLIGILREYVDWAFEEKMKNRKINITSMGLLTNARVMNEFLQFRKHKVALTQTRSYPLPKDFLLWVQENAPDILKKHQFSILEHLNMLIKYSEQYNLDNNQIEIIVLNKARELGLLPKEGKLELK